MSRQARIEPIFEASDLNKDKVIGWAVVDESVPGNDITVSEHETQAEAIKAAEEYEQREDPR